MLLVLVLVLVLASSLETAFYTSISQTEHYVSMVNQLVRNGITE